MYENVEQYLDESNPMGEESSSEVETQETEGQADEQPESQSLEDQLEGVEVNGEGESPDLLSLVNELGLIRNGLPVEYQSLDDIKEHLQKGYDYTAKTQELAEMRKQAETELSEQREAFAQEREAFEQEAAGMQEAVVENQIMAEIFQQLQLEEPEVFAEIQRSFQQRMGLYNQSVNSPHVQALKGELSEIKKQLGERGKQEQEAKNGEIVKAWESGLQEVQTQYAPKLRTLGVKPNWSEVQKVWQADASGQMTVKQAMLAVHGEDISKALEAQSKLAKTRAESMRRKGPSGVSGEGVTPKNNDSYLSAAEELYRHHVS